MNEAGWPMLTVGCALALIGLQLEGDQHWVDAGIFRRIWNTFVPELRIDHVTTITAQMTKARSGGTDLRDSRGPGDENTEERDLELEEQISDHLSRLATKQRGHFIP